MKTNKLWTHKELAVLYFPDILPKSASTQLTRWITRDEELMAELKKTGYTKRQRMYSPAQLVILLKHFGEPETGIPEKQ